MYSLLQDLRYGLRSLRNAPGFTAIAVITLALGIGVNTAIFSIVYAVLLRPLPFREPGQLVSIQAELNGLGLRNVGVSVPELDDLAQRSGIFEQVCAVWPIDANLTGTKTPERVEGIAVGANYFSLLGVTSAQMGRLFGPQDEAEGFAEAAVISDGAWTRLFGRDPNILGRKMLIDNDPYTIVGVLPRGFRHPGRTVIGDVEVYTAAGFRAAPFLKPPVRRARFLPSVLGRLKPGMTVKEATARLATFSATLRQEYPSDYRTQERWELRLTPLHELLVGKSQPLLLVLLGAVALILLIACANVANLLLARASSRQREIAVRLAVGARRSRLVRQLLTESVLLSVIAGGAGVLTALWAQSAMLALVPAKLPRVNEITINGGVLAFALGISVLTGIVFGIFPALQASGVDVITSLKDAGRITSSSQGRMRAAFVVSEIALSLVLMAGAGLLLRTFWMLLQVDPGFNPGGVISARIWLPVPNDPKTDVYGNVQQRTQWARESLRRVREIPGATDAAISSSMPLIGTVGRATFQVEGRPASSDAASSEALSVTPNYFSVLGTPLIKGRFFAETDQVDAPTVMIIDSAAARRLWPGEDPLGKRIIFPPTTLFPTPLPVTVVGIVGDVKYDSLDEQGTPHLYLSLYQRNSKNYAVLLRGNGDPAALGEAIRREVQSVDPNLPVYNITPMREVVAASLAERRFSATMVAGFALLALLLAGIGVYGVVAYSVTQRTHEIGIRMALGARTAQVIGLVLAHGLRLAWIGVGVGLVFALAATRLLSALLFGVSSRDPLVFAVIAAILVAVAVLASYVPARRAASVDPLVALRCE
jgi:predicted permease